MSKRLKRHVNTRFSHASNWTVPAVPLLFVVFGITTLGTGCFPEEDPGPDPNLPPSASSLFTPSSGADLNDAPGLVTLDDALFANSRIGNDHLSEPLVCYSYDGSTPNYSVIENVGGFCQGEEIGITEKYRGAAFVECTGAELIEGGIKNKTLKVVYYWDYNDGNGHVRVDAQASYTVNCITPSANTQFFKLEGSGILSGFVIGGVEILSGSARLNDEYDIDNGKAQLTGVSKIFTSNDFADLEIESSFQITGDWAWNNEEDVTAGGVLSNFVDTSIVTKCTPFPKPPFYTDGCENVSYSVSDLGVTTNPIIFNLANFGDETYYSTHIIIDALGLEENPDDDVITDTNFTLIRIPPP